MHKFFLFLLLITINQSHAIIENLIFELDEIIFEINASPMLARFGLGSYGDQMADKYHQRLVDLMEKNEKEDQKDLQTSRAIYKKIKLPIIWCKYLLNKITGKEAREKCDSIIGAHAGWVEKSLLYKASSVAFNPEEEVALFNPNEKLVKLISKLKDQFKLYILTNKNKDTIEALRKKYPEIMKYFDDVICSGDLGHIKPDTQVFKKLMESHKIEPGNSLVIEKEQECYKQVKELGFQAILYENCEKLEKLIDEISK